MKRIKNVNFFQIDLKDAHKINLDNITIVLSDIAPNISGVSVVDSENMKSLLEIEISIVDKFLKIGGKYLCKCFEGDSMNFLKNKLKYRFRTIKRIKPDASRSTSKECYILGIDKI